MTGQRYRVNGTGHRSGYVDRPEDLPIAFRSLQFMRSELQKRQRGNAEAASVYAVEDFDFSRVSVGKVDSAVASRSNEAHVMVGSDDFKRTYADTRFGDIHIHEMTRAKMGVMDPSALPNFVAAGQEGYRTIVRYADGRMATLLLLPRESGVALLEIGDTFETRDGERTLQAFVSTFVLAKQE